MNEIYLLPQGEQELFFRAATDIQKLKLFIKIGS
jgi:hypothetical protein